MQRDDWEGFWKLESNAARGNSSQLSHSQSKSGPSDSNLVHTETASLTEIISDDPNTNTDAIINLLIIDYLIIIS